MGGRSGMTRALRDFVGAFVPLRVRELERELADRVGKIPTRVNEYGFDPYGFSPESLKRSALLAALLYRLYFRVDTRGAEHVPPGRVLLIANHAGQLPFDGMMLSMAMLLEADPPRIVRAMGEYWIPTLPGFSVWMARGGVVAGTRETCAAMLEAGEAVLVFPEGVRGMNKLFSERYRLQRFGLGFMRLALETDTPIVPVAIVGSEEQQPAFTHWPRVGKALGMPAFPVTPTFPWLGPLGLLPLPVRYRIRFGAPMHFAGGAQDDDEEIEEKVAQVKRALATLLAKGRRARRGVFR